MNAVSTISCNNDAELGEIIAEAYSKVGKNGVVFMEESETNETYVDVVEGVQLDVGLTSPHWVTNTEKHKCELDNPQILIVYSEIPNIRSTLCIELYTQQFFTFCKKKCKRIRSKILLRSCLNLNP